MTEEHIPEISEFLGEKRQTKPLADLEGQIFVISEVQFVKPRLYKSESAILKINGEYYRTSSEVIVEELKRVKQYPVRARLAKKVSENGFTYHMLV